ncbi:MAG: uncharacterized protein KVP18_004272 [Porospora cf. gigantea A]|uniref:uncharacterized protein n=1 Tax=Porospora cf. gigantea A TaxID=2853593 RepID=UPI00355A02DD|nr:MAG: hypothetical protein KVP18_004272 [Porospora cf. gigantea A]
MRICLILTVIVTAQVSVEPSVKEVKPEKNFGRLTSDVEALEQKIDEDLGKRQVKETMENPADNPFLLKSEAMAKLHEAEKAEIKQDEEENQDREEQAKSEGERDGSDKASDAIKKKHEMHDALGMKSKSDQEDDFEDSIRSSEAAHADALKDAEKSETSVENGADKRAEEVLESDGEEASKMAEQTAEKETENALSEAENALDEKSEQDAQLETEKHKDMEDEEQQRLRVEEQCLQRKQAQLQACDQTVCPTILPCDRVAQAAEERLHKATERLKGSLLTHKQIRQHFSVEPAGKAGEVKLNEEFLGAAPAAEEPSTASPANSSESTTASPANSSESIPEEAPAVDSSSIPEESPAVESSSIPEEAPAVESS